MAVGEPLLEELYGKSVSERTLAAYKKAWKRWQLFCESSKREGSTKDLLSFLALMYREGKSKAGASATLAAISHFSVAEGRPEIVRSPVISKVIKGWARAEGPRVDEREPIVESRLTLVIRALKKVCFDQFEYMLFRAAFTLAFGGALRLSELVPPSKKAAGKGLMDKHVVIQEGKALDYVSRSKTDQEGKGRWIGIEATGKITCTVKALVNYRTVRPGGGQLLLLHKDSSPLSAFQFSQVLKKAVIVNGWDPKKFSSYSFRIGAATEAAMRGECIEKIKKMGRWKSEAYRKYIRPVEKMRKGS
ncbi:uncharacterized protein LOC121401588 isoform X3 [Xenopus laevis]|uniref:Uncharacterized protein LOC121401588 isoform X3 n=1 Tax=Xenopus laevis TaxID=8355 RepID=A0A8J1MPJ0_XENLA|nr:uncharacterized protein LOC121401588 isoform X3 [Xenopus laevis]